MKAAASVAMMLIQERDGSAHAGGGLALMEAGSTEGELSVTTADDGQLSDSQD